MSKVAAAPSRHRCQRPAVDAADPARREDADPGRVRRDHRGRHRGRRPATGRRGPPRGSAGPPFGRCPPAPWPAPRAPRHRGRRGAPRRGSPRSPGSRRPPAPRPRMPRRPRRFCGYGRPWLISVDSSATTGRPAATASATSGVTRSRSATPDGIPMWQAYRRGYAVAHAGPSPDDTRRHPSPGRGRRARSRRRRTGRHRGPSLHRAWPLRQSPVCHPAGSRHDRAPGAADRWHRPRYPPAPVPRWTDDRVRARRSDGRRCARGPGCPRPGSRSAQGPWAGARRPAPWLRRRRRARLVARRPTPRLHGGGRSTAVHRGPGSRRSTDADADGAPTGPALPPTTRRSRGGSPAPTGGGTKRVMSIGGRTCSCTMARSGSRRARSRPATGASARSRGTPTAGPSRSRPTAAPTPIPDPGRRSGRSTCRSKPGTARGPRRGRAPRCARRRAPTGRTARGHGARRLGQPRGVVGGRPLARRRGRARSGPARRHQPGHPPRSGRRVAPTACARTRPGPAHRELGGHRPQRLDGERPIRPVLGR